MQGREFNNIGGMNSAMNLQEKLANRVIIQELRSLEILQTLRLLSLAAGALTTSHGRRLESTLSRK